MEDDHHKNLDDLCAALLLLETTEEVRNFLHDLCTPAEISSLAERWRVCRLLANKDLSYREIHRATGASLTTIGRVARFLKDEPYHGYLTILNKLKRMKNDNGDIDSHKTESG
jgi:TrpR-related protein YerC/YecD